MSRNEYEIQAAEIILQSGAEGTIDALVRLEGLIADAIVQARSKAFEECAKIAEDIAAKNHGYTDGPGALRVCNAIRSKAKGINPKVEDKPDIG